MFASFGRDAFPTVDLRRLQPRRSATLSLGCHESRQTQRRNLPRIGGRRARPKLQPGRIQAREMKHNYLDTMDVVKRFGKPDFFITMTTNPAWPEITTTTLCFGETAANRPDLVARVCKTKLRVLLDTLLKEHVFGKLVGYTWVI